MDEQKTEFLLPLFLSGIGLAAVAVFLYILQQPSLSREPEDSAFVLPEVVVCAHRPTAPRYRLAEQHSTTQSWGS